MSTIRLTMAQALTRFLCAKKTVMRARPMKRASRRPD
jgi:TPP-dependent trihydroxycyclohexane-1,2-dione (THcHDO) dehydratase